MQMSQSPNSLRCTIKDKRDLVFYGAHFCPIFWSPWILMS
jgi:hypothetical protein